MSKYDDIIDMPRHVSAVRRLMPMEARAAQFAPFAALTGHDEILSYTVRVNEREYESEPDDFSESTGGCRMYPYDASVDE